MLLQINGNATFRKPVGSGIDIVCHQSESFDILTTRSYLISDDEMPHDGTACDKFQRPTGTTTLLKTAPDISWVANL